MASNGRSSDRVASSKAYTYAPAWERKSLDIVPPNDQALPKNPIADDIMGVDTASSQTPMQSPQNVPDQSSSEHTTAES